MTNIAGSTFAADVSLSATLGERPETIVFQLVNPLRALKEIVAANRNKRADFWEHGEFL